MKMVKPKANCKLCKKPIYANVDSHPDKMSKDGYNVICNDCTQDMTLGIHDMEEELRTDFKGTEDAGEKVAYYNTRIEEAKKLNIPPAKIKAKGFGSRLKEIRKKLNLTQTQVAEYFNITRRSIVYYEKNERKIPVKIKEWTRTAESTFRHFKRKEGEKKVMEKLLNIAEPKKSSKWAKTCEALGGNVNKISVVR